MSATTSAAELTTPVSFDGTLMSHQLTSLRFLQQNPRALCALDVGLGKTATAAGLIAWMLDTDQLHARPDSPAVVVLTDPSLLEQMARELRRFCPTVTVATSNDSRFKSTQPSATSVRKLIETQGSSALVVVASYPWWSARQRTTAAAWLPQLVLLDEATAVSGGGKQHAAALNLSARADRVAGLTATPFQSNPMQSFHLLQAIGTPGLWSRQDFERDFVWWQEPQQLRTGAWTDRRPKGFLTKAREIEFGQYLRQVMVRFTAEDAGQPLPRLVREVVWVPLHANQRDAYERASRNPTQASTTLMDSAARCVRDESSLVDELVRRMTGPLCGRQAIVYCESLDVLPLAAAALSAAGITCVGIQGKDDAKARENALSCFRDGTAQILLASAVLERGLNLQHCDLLISLDSSWTEDREAQREGRIRRLGSDHTSCTHLVLMPDTDMHRAKKARVDARATTARRVLDEE